METNTESKKWAISEDNFKKIPLKNGMYRCKLEALKPIRVKSKFSKEEDGKVEKILFAFVPLSVKFDPETERCSISTLVTPSKNDRGNMYKLVQSMSGGGIPDSALESGEAWQAYVESMIGYTFNVMCKHEKGYNNVVNVMPLELEDVNRAFEEISEGNKKEKTVPSNGKTYPEKFKAFKYIYNIKNLEAEKLDKVATYAQENKASYFVEDKIIASKTELPQLVRYFDGENLTFDTDEIPF